MADNTTTYKAVIETEVKGQKSLEDMNKSVEDGADKFKSLRSQIRETTVKLQEMADQGKTGTKEFKALANQLDDLGDAQKKVAFQSGQIATKLGFTKKAVEGFNEAAKKSNDAFFDQAQKDLDNMKVVQDIIKAQDEKKKSEAAERHRKYLEKIAEQQKEADEKEKKDLEKQLAIIESVRKRFKAGEFDVVGSDGLTAKEREKALKEEAERKEYFQKKMDDHTKKMQPQMTAWALAHTRTALSAEIDLKNQSVKKQTKLEAFLTSDKKKNLDAQLVAAKAALELAGALVDEHSVAGKAIAVTLAVINTYQGATAALASLPPPFSFIAAAAVVAAGLLNVNKILSTQIPSAKPSGGSGGGGAGGADITPPSIPQISAPDINVSGGQNPTSALAGTLAQASNRPIKAYVVSTEMSSNQALDRRTNRAATLSGG